MRFLACQLCLLVLVATYPSSGRSEEAETEGQGSEVKLPAIQAKFMDLVCAAQDAEMEAMNDLQKVSVTKKLEQDLRKLFKKSKKIKNWQGSLGLMELDRKGRVTVIILQQMIKGKYSVCDVMFGNVEKKGLFDKRYFTTIKHGSKLFKKLSDLQLGQDVEFSGSFVVNKMGVPRHDRLDAYFIRLTDIGVGGQDVYSADEAIQKPSEKDEKEDLKPLDPSAERMIAHIEAMVKIIRVNKDNCDKIVKDLQGYTFKHKKEFKELTMQSKEMEKKMSGQEKKDYAARMMKRLEPVLKEHMVDMMEVNQRCPDHADEIGKAMKMSE